MLFVGILYELFVHKAVFSTQVPLAPLRRKEAGERGKESAR